MCAASIGVALTACAAPAAGFTDRVRTAGGSEAGEITSLTPLEITLDKGTAGTVKIPVNQVRSVLFDEEPPELTQARLNAKNGGYATAIERLDAIDRSSVKRDMIGEDVEFYLAYCAAKQALGGKGEVTDAGRKLNEFVRRHPQNFHYLEAVETMGDLLMASDKYAAAQKQYAELAKTPWPDYKLRAARAPGPHAAGPRKASGGDRAVRRGAGQRRHRRRGHASKSSRPRSPRR